MKLALLGTGMIVTEVLPVLTTIEGIELEAIMSTPRSLDKAEALAKQYGLIQTTSDYEVILSNPDVDTIYIGTPNHTHYDYAKQALLAGKHVICEKPLTGYFGKPGEENVGRTEKAKMYREVMAIMDELKEVVDSTDKKFLYAENFVYATPVQKAAEIIRAKKSKVLFMKGEESLKGSSSPVAGKWNKTGGGILVRTGTHPLTGMLWLKQQEALAREEKMQEAMLSIRKKFGKNAILKGMNFKEGATARQRNGQIGGHKA